MYELHQMNKQISEQKNIRVIKYIEIYQININKYKVIKVKIEENLEFKK